MPLFGSKHNNNDNIETTTGGGRHHHMNPDNGLGTTGNYPAGTTGTGMLGNDAYPASQQSQGMMAGQQGYGHSGLGGSDNLAQNQYGTTGHGLNNETGYGTGGMGMGGHGQTPASGIPSTGMVNHGTTGHTSGSGGTGQRLTGKVESAIGTLVGSSSLKAKGLQKEQEANAIKLQGRELAEAERLEREALMRRERAVGHGAHPANSQLGAGHIGTGNLGTGAGGTGTGY